MIRRITIEMDLEEPGEVVKDILDMVAARLDANIEFSIKQEFFPERVSGNGIQVPDFLRKGSGMDG